MMVVPARPAHWITMMMTTKVVFREILLPVVLGLWGVDPGVGGLDPMKICRRGQSIF